MKKQYISSLIIFMATLLVVSMNSCGDDNDDGYEVSQEWKDHQSSVLTRAKVAKNEETNEDVFTHIVSSESGLGSIYTGPSDYITKNQEGEFGDGPTVFSTKASKRSIYETDSVEIRYEGWYYNLDDKRVMFDSTEKDASTGESTNNTKSMKSVISSPDPNKGFIDGFKTALLDMKVGEERIICIPYQLGYGVYSTSAIPGCTTLFFDVKILRNFTEEEELAKTM